MTAKTRWSARLTVTALAAGTLTIAAPAHADRACDALMDEAQRQFYLYEWYGIALGYNSTEARSHLKESAYNADFWMVNC